MKLLLAAATATVAALIEVSVAPHLRVNGAQPHVVLVLAVILTLAARPDIGFVFAFAGGLALDVFAPRPLGASAIALLLAAGGASLAAEAVPRRFRVLLPILIFPVASIVASVILLAVLTITSTPAGAPEVIRQLVPGALYDAALAAALGPLAVAVLARRVVAEAPAF
jgi:rod shape-determining protein MreD